MQSVDAVLRQAAADLDAIGARWAVIGGLAVAFRAEPRFTKDVDLAVAVADDREAEGIVNRLQVRGYALASLVEQDYVSRLCDCPAGQAAGGRVERVHRPAVRELRHRGRNRPQG